jgi:dual specificity phosphatase 12
MMSDAKEEPLWAQFVDSPSKKALTCPQCEGQYSGSLGEHLTDGTHMNEITPGLYVGAVWNATNPAELRYHKIDCILNCTYEITNPKLRNTFGAGCYKQVQWDDVCDTRILEDLPEVVVFIHKCVKAGKHILVHCAAGRSRSVSAVIAYLIKSRAWTFEAALKHVQERRSVANPNTGFQHQLRLYDKILRSI